MKNLSILFYTLLLLTFGLTDTSARSSETKQMNVAILIFDNVQIVDYTGPYEVFGSSPAKSGNVRPFKVYTVSEKASPVTTNMGMSVNATYNFENAPKTDILIIPGGGGLSQNSPGVNAQLKNPTVIKWVQDSARDAKIVLSVCNGAFIIAQAGLLDGLEATTTAGDFISALRKQYPKIKNVFYDRRFVDNGKVVTTAGLSSGIDGSLHVVEKLFGRTIAKLNALGMEYNWDPDSRYARAALADRNIPQSIYEAFYGDETELVEFNGNTDSWEEVYLTPSTSTSSEMIKQIEVKMGKENNWTKANVNVNASTVSSTSWNIKDEKGQAWNTSVKVQSGKINNQLLITLKVSRIS